MNTVYLYANGITTDLELLGNIRANRSLKGVLKINDLPQTLKAKLSTTKVLRGVISGGEKLSGVVNIGNTTTTVPIYTGEYEVVPARYDQVLQTSNKLLRENVTVVEIPYSEVSNLGGGTTFYIAKE